MPEPTRRQGWTLVTLTIAFAGFQFGVSVARGFTVIAVVGIVVLLAAAAAAYLALRGLPKHEETHDA